MVRQLLPWYANIGKRQVRAHKVYLRDTGLLRGLSGCRLGQPVAHPVSAPRGKALSLSKRCVPSGLLRRVLGDAPRRRARPLIFQRGPIRL